jgi:hypothetical protein
MTRALLVAAVGLFSTLGFQTPAARAQVSTLEVLQRTAMLVGLEEGKGNQVLLVLIDHVAQGGTTTQTYTLSGGNTYRVYAVGDDNRIADIDLAVYSNGNLVRRDDKEANVAAVSFFVGVTQKFAFKVTPYKLRPGARDGFYGLVIVREK